MEEYLNSQECGKFIKRTPGAVRNLVLRRAIPYRKAGGRLLFLRSELEKWIDSAEGLRLVDNGNGYELEEING
jgi:hypothetical protein